MLLSHRNIRPFMGDGKPEIIVVESRISTRSKYVDVLAYLCFGEYII